ncbi:Cu(I)-responsive transcriptional regulator [bacterium]|nr:Cu(I)-responsive transcriptional regulator [bacterium]
MVIGELARRTGVSAKTIRYYEESGLVPRPRRAANGYRVYGEQAVHVLRFVKRARDLGFTMEEVGELLSLWRDDHRESAEVKEVAEAHLAAIERKITELAAMRDTLRGLVHACHGDKRPDCPILDDLADRGGGPIRQE